MDKVRLPSFNNSSFIREDLSIAIQAGGKSTRMGRNKSKIAFLGKPLILRVLEKSKIYRAKRLSFPTPTTLIT